MKPPIKYYGGKGNMINKILEHFPSDYTIYVEPFGGSFSLGLKQNAKIEIYNDLEKNVYTLYKVISDNKLFQEFKFKADLTPYSEDLRKEYIEKLKTEKLTEVERAFYYFYVNRTSHSGTGGFSVSNIIRRNMSKSISDYLSAIDRLEQLHQRLSKVIMFNRNGIEIIRKYNHENVFIYCDPPYHQSTRTGARYKQDMNNEQHIEFLKTVIESKAKILISGYKNEIYDDYLQEWTEIQFEVKTMSGNYQKKVKTETLWKNY